MATLTLQKYPTQFSSAFDVQKFIVVDADDNYTQQDFQYIAKINIFDTTDEADIVATIKVKPYFDNGVGYFDIGNILTQYVNTFVQYKPVEISDDMHSDHQELVKYNIIWEYYYVGNTGTVYAGTYDTVTNAENEYWITGSYANYEYFLSQSNVGNYLAPSVTNPGLLINGLNRTNYNVMFSSTLQSISGLVFSNINETQISDTVHIHTVTADGLTKDFYYEIITASNTDLTTQLQHFTFSVNSLNNLTPDAIVLSNDPSEYENPNSIVCEDISLTATFAKKGSIETIYTDFWIPSAGELLTLIDVLGDIPNDYVDNFFIATDAIYASSTNLHESSITDAAVYEQGGWVITGVTRSENQIFIPCHIISSSVEYQLKDWLGCGFIFEIEESGGEYFYKVANLFNTFKGPLSDIGSILPDTTGQFGIVATQMLATALIAAGYNPIGGVTPVSGVLSVTEFESLNESLTSFRTWYVPNLQDMSDIINTGCGSAMDISKQYGTSEPKSATAVVSGFEWNGSAWIISDNLTRSSLFNYFIIHRFYSEEDFAVASYAKAGFVFRKESFGSGWYYWICSERAKRSFSNDSDTTSYWLFGGDSVTMTVTLNTELTNLLYDRSGTYIIDAYQTVVYILETIDAPVTVYQDTHQGITWTKSCCDPSPKLPQQYQIGYTNMLGGTSYFNVLKKSQSFIETEKNFYRIYNRDYPNIMTRNNKVINATSKSSVVVNSNWLVNDVQIDEVQQLISSQSLTLHLIGTPQQTVLPCILRKYKFNNSPLRNGMKQVEFELEFDYDNKITF